MTLFSTRLLGQASRIFLASAYPDASAIPEAKRAYHTIAEEAPVEHYLTPAPLARGICQRLEDGGYTFRLGSKHYANLKLKIQPVNDADQRQWVCSVDTHDAFSKEHVQPPPDHPDAPAWLELQSANRALKQKIERAWEGAGVLTHMGLLRRELAGASK